SSTLVRPFLTSRPVLYRGFGAGADGYSADLYRVSLPRLERFPVRQPAPPTKPTARAGPAEGARLNVAPPDPAPPGSNPPLGDGIPCFPGPTDPVACPRRVAAPAPARGKDPESG